MTPEARRLQRQVAIKLRRDQLRHDLFVVRVAMGCLENGVPEAVTLPNSRNVFASFARLAIFFHEQITAGMDATLQPPGRGLGKSIERHAPGMGVER